MSELTHLGIAEQRDKLRKKEFSARELTQSYLEKIDAARTLNAYSLVTEDVALEMAQKADDRLQSADAPDLCGIPLGVKDIFCTKNIDTQAASKILEGFKPEYESTVTQQLWAQTAVMLGKLNMDEFAMGSSNETSIYGPAISPWRAEDDPKTLTPGGSSGGSAAAVSADLCAAALGTDTGGSIRQPAAFTGIVGLKPTYGRVSRWGIVAFASSLDQAGPMTKSVQDCAILLAAMSGHDPKDSTSADIAVPDFEAALKGDIRGKKIGIPKEYRMEGMPSEIEKLWQKGAEMLKDAGAEIVDISLPHTKYALPAYYVIAPAEASSNLSRYDGVRYGYRAALEAGDDIHDLYRKTRAEGFGAEVQRRVMIGSYVLSAGFYDAYYRRAQKVRTLIKKDFDDAYESGIDAILTPTTPSAAFALGEMANADPIEMYLNDVFTVTVNMAGMPAISVPVDMSSNGLPLGLQLIGKPWHEGELLNLASQLEKSACFSQKPKNWWA